MDTSYLAQQVTTIIGQLHGLFDDIGVPSHERDSREAELFSALSETLHNQLRHVTNEKHEMTEEAQRLIKTIKQMEASLDDTKPKNAYDIDSGDVKVTYPLTKCIQSLKEKYNMISKVHRERFEEVKKLAQALDSYASHLEPSFLKVTLPPLSANASVSPSFDLSASYVTALDHEFTRVYDEYTRRVNMVQVTCEEIIKLWAELGTPQAQTDSAIVENYRESPEQLGLHQDDLARLRSRKDKLIDEKRGRERRLKELRTMVEGLWERLSVEEHERKGFLANNRGCGMRTINEFEDELARLNELKRQNLHLFVEDARYKLQELWDTLYFSEEEMLDFTPAFSEVYSDALLSAHEAEIDRLESLKEQRLPTLQMIDRHRSLIKERDDLATSSQDASRLMARGQKGEKRDPGKLLREEKMRKRIAKELPKVEADLKKILERWEDEYGRPFLVHGHRYLDELNAASSRGAPPARSKTPSVPAQPVKAKPTPSSQQRSGTIRGGGTQRAKTPNLNMSVNRKPDLNNSSFIGGGGSCKSPTRIPGRAPLKSLRDGNNSPERQQGQNSTVRKMGPPMAPPPRLKDLFSPPPQPQFTPTPSSRQEQYQYQRQREYDHDHEYSREYERSGSVMRQVHPDDSYDDRTQMSMLMQSTRSAYYPPAPRPASRQISASSSTGTGTTGTTVSGSENWETYDDASDTEPEASDEYYAKLRLAASRNKRFTPEGGYPSPKGGHSKKFRGIRGVGPESEMAEGENGELVRVGGSEASWTDEDAF